MLGAASAEIEAKLKSMGELSDKQKKTVESSVFISSLN